MSFWEWLGLASICFAGAASPGPSLAVVLGAVIGGGRSHGLIAAWSHAAGVGLYAALTVFGLSTVITLVPWLFRGIQIAGALYLLWLASKLLRSTGSSLGDDERGSSSAISAARDGFAVAFLNPKLAVFMLALFSQFVKPEAGAATTALLIGTATIVDGLWYSFVTLLVGQPRLLESLRARATIIDRVFGVLIGVIALSILGVAISASVQ